jgi:hypothetical protein
VTAVRQGTGADSPAAFRCSAASQDWDEPLEGSASTVRAFLLVEAPGPWGVDAVRDSRLPGEVKQRLSELESRHRIRPLLIRRHGGGASDTSARLFAAYVHGEKPWVESCVLSDVRESLDLDLDGLGVGQSPGLTPHTEPLFLVCTHGKHDACCAERGRPLCAALTRTAPAQTWEVSHIGGDRFAANLLVLPHGLYYGRVGPENASDFARRHLAGELDLEHLRGRSSYPFSVQAAEIYLRREIGALGIEPLVLEEHRRQGVETRAVFSVSGGGDTRLRWEVRVHTDLGEPRQLTCRATSPSTGFSHRLLGVTPL